MATTAAAASPAATVAPAATGDKTKLVIVASSLGTVFEWYDFFIYGTLAAIVGRTFFPADSEVAQLLLALAGFAVGFGVRPLGAVLFGYLGDKLGRKYTFLVTITLMGLATAAIGFVPSAATIGAAAPIILITLRVLQGLALGGEYGGAAIYVAEHSPPGKAGFYTSFIQASVAGGFILSLAVVLTTQAVVGEAAWNAWGWRIPFLFSLVLLAISLWMRLKLSESPVFQEMKAAGEVARNPLKETFTYPGNGRRLFVALFGIAAGLTVIWYTAMFQVLYFLQQSLKVEEGTAQLLVGIGAASGLVWFILFGWLSDRVGRKWPIVIGYALTLLLLFPIFKTLGAAANPGLAAASARAPVVVAGQGCAYNPFAKTQANACGAALDLLTKRGVTYETYEDGVTAGGQRGPITIQSGVAVGGRRVGAGEYPTAAELDLALGRAGYDLAKVRPTGSAIAVILACVLALSALSGMTYGPVAALLAELFPPRIRYSSLSIPYHIGTGYFGGFLPVISQYMVARSGDPYAGLWYTVAVVAMALAVTLFLLPNDLGRSKDTAHA